MQTLTMYPPADGSNNSITINGRTYQGPGAQEIDTRDAAEAVGFGWTGYGWTSAIRKESIYAKISRLAKAARYDNPRVNAALIGSIAWAASTAYTLGQQRNNDSGKVYEVITAGTSAGSGGPTGTGADITDGTVHWKYVGAQTAPTVTGGTTAAGLTKIYAHQTDMTPFATYGGTTIPWAALPEYLLTWSTNWFSTGSGTIASNPPRDGLYWRLEFMADAVKVAISVYDLTTNKFRFIVDGQYVDLTPTTTPNGGTNPYFLTLDFTNVGGRKMRRIMVESDAGGRWKDVRVGPTESIHHVPTDDHLTMVVGGDSFTGSTGATHKFDGWAIVMGDYLGIRNLISSGSGGTGYLNSVSGTKYTMRQRINDLLGPNPDIIGIAMGVNDTGFTVSDVQTELGLTIDAIRAARPTVPLFIFGPWHYASQIAAVRNIEGGIKSTVEARMAADDNLFFVPVTGTGAANDKPWFFGTGRTGAPASDGNADLYVGGTDGSDTIHPSPAGHFHLGRRGADGILTAIAGRS
jgi:lysophospholipase L1-like esterase